MEILCRLGNQRSRSPEITEGLGRDRLNLLTFPSSWITSPSLITRAAGWRKCL